MRLSPLADCLHRKPTPRRLSKNIICMLTCPFHLLSFQFIAILSLAAFLAFVAAIMGFVFIGKVHLLLGCQRNIDNIL